MSTSREKCSEITDLASCQTLLTSLFSIMKQSQANVAANTTSVDTTALIVTLGYNPPIKTYRSASSVELCPSTYIVTKSLIYRASNNYAAPLALRVRQR